MDNQTIVKKKYLPQSFLKRIDLGSQASIEYFIVLSCSIFIASVGLNMNSTAVIIGSMLISPLMSPILGIGVSVGTYNNRMFFNAVTTFIIEVAISLIVAALYFHFSPLTYASTEIVSRTSPTLWDALIALFGGIAGIVGARQSRANNIVSGVAIATALMPPLCTAGYGLATGNSTYFFGAMYLFLINTVFIILTSFFGVKVLQILDGDRKVRLFRLDRRHLLVYIGIIVLMIPSIISTRSLVLDTVVDHQVDEYVKNTFSNSTVISQTLDKEDKTLKVTTTGTVLTKKEVKSVKKDLADYGLSGYNLKLTQVADVSALTGDQLTAYINKLINKNNKVNEEKEEAQTKTYQTMNKTIKAMDTDITTVLTGKGADDKETGLFVVIQSRKEISAKKQEKLRESIMDKYPKVAKVSFVLLSKN